MKLSEKQVLAKSRASELESVINLNCWGSELTDVSIFEKLEKVEVINASANELSSLKDFQRCENLRELYLRNNNISDLTEFCHLKNLDNLRLLVITDNPVCSNEDDYRTTVIKILPQLTTLDNIIVTEEELLESQEKGKDLKLSLKLETEDEEIKENNSQTTSDTEKSNTDIIEATHPVITTTYSTTSPLQSAVQMSLDETNQLRKELGFKPVPADKYSSPVKHTYARTQVSNNILLASLALIEELDEEGLKTLHGAIEDKLQTYTIVSSEERPAVSVKSRVKKIIDMG